MPGTIPRRLFLAPLVVILAAGLFSALSWIRNVPPRTVPEQGIDTRFSPSALASDLEFLRATFEDIHPDLYAHTTRHATDALLSELEAGIDHPLTRREFWPIVARFAASFGDGHTGAFFPEAEIRRRRDRVAPWFPLDVDTFSRGRLRVAANHEPGSPIEPGAWIIRIEDQTVADLFPRCVATMSGEKEFYRRRQALRNFPYLLWLLGYDSPFTVTWKAAGGGPARQTVLQGVRMEELVNEGHRQQAPSPDFRFKRMADDIGYLELRRMLRRKPFSAFLARTFQEIREQPVRGLVVDLRRNGGGSTSLGDDLLSYLTDKPYRMISRMDVKVSRRKKRWLKANYLPRALRWLPVEYLSARGRRIWRAPEGSIVSWSVREKQPPANPLRFQGPVCVLIGARTFSSAQKLANAIKDYHLATLIGEETGGNPNACGEALPFFLPHTRLEVRASTKRYIRANGDASWTRGILPDITVISPPDALEEGRDPVLAAALEWIKSQH